QLYQLPLPVVAAIVRNVRAVFPHVQVWYSSPWDLMVMGSAHSITYDRTWLDQVLQPASPLGTAAREYLGVTATDEYFGHLALGEAGVQRLLASGVGEGLVHRDDRPRL